MHRAMERRDHANRSAPLLNKSPLVRTKVPVYFEAYYLPSMHDTH